jgi:hypothetical protein
VIHSLGRQLGRDLGAQPVAQREGPAPLASGVEGTQFLQQQRDGAGRAPLFEPIWIKFL